MSATLPGDEGFDDALRKASASYTRTLDRRLPSFRYPPSPPEILLPSIHNVFGAPHPTSTILPIREFEELNISDDANVATGTIHVEPWQLEAMEWVTTLPQREPLPTPATTHSYQSYPPIMDRGDQAAWHRLDSATNLEPRALPPNLGGFTGATSCLCTSDWLQLGSTVYPGGAHAHPF